ncbi:protein kinase [Arthrobacter crystallopoietes]|uniref:serine/threonine-protein kinase n=1 Tax=Crystallibacter crystallopoietes TaxID=37928 RepID=UPI003D22062C
MSSTTAPELRGSLLNDRYQVGPVIGRGGMGTVYRAVDHVLRREVAVKVFHPDLHQPGLLDLQRLETETMARLNHPGLVALYDAGTARHDRQELSFIVMELVAGVDLRLQLAAAPLGLETTVRLGARLAATLHYIHGRATIHRDIKPSNILLARYSDDEDPQPKLADFGIATLIGRPRPVPELTVGTAAYLSPEQVRGLEAGPPSDIYSLGLVLLQCLTGETEYQGPPIDSALARLTRPPWIPADLPGGVAELLQAMTDSDEVHRPTAAEVTLSLRRAGSDPDTARRLRDPAHNEAPGARPPDRAPLLPALRPAELTNATRAFLPVAVAPAPPTASLGQLLPRDAPPPARRRSFPRRRAAILASAAATALAGVAVLPAMLPAVFPSDPAGSAPNPAVLQRLDDNLTLLEESLAP